MRRETQKIKCDDKKEEEDKKSRFFSNLKLPLEFGKLILTNLAFFVILLHWNTFCETFFAILLRQSSQLLNYVSKCFKSERNFYFFWCQIDIFRLCEGIKIEREIIIGLILISREMFLFCCFEGWSERFFYENLIIFKQKWHFERLSEQSWNRATCYTFFTPENANHEISWWFIAGFFSLSFWFQ